MSQLIQAKTIWQEQAEALQRQLEEIRPLLIEAEARLAEQLAAMSAFEFKLRSRLEPMMNRIDRLQAEIRKLRQELRRLQEEGPMFEADEADEWLRKWGMGSEQAAGAYQYRERPFAPEKGHPELSEDESAEMKRLYRRLARRFHPDLAPNEADRAYRTDLMMRINAAYAAGDLERLKALALEPDSVSGDYLYTDQELVETLQRELESCQRRLQEIERERARLARHESSRMMARADKLEAVGRDFFEEMWRELRGELDKKQVERDILESEVQEAQDKGQDVVALDDLADTVYDLGLEQALLEEDPTLAFEDWAYGGRNPLDWGDNDDILDE